MPEDLSLYLFDRYGEEPVEGEIIEQFFYPRVYSDVCNYIKGELAITLCTDLEKLQDQYDELSDILSRIVDEKEFYATELFTFATLFAGLVKTKNMNTLKKCTS